MSKIRLMKTASVVLALPFLYACAVAPSGQGPEEVGSVESSESGSATNGEADEESSLRGDQTFAEISVVRHEDGSVTVSERQVTVAEQIRAREFEAQRQEALKAGVTLNETMSLPVSSCTSSTLRLFSLPNHLGTTLCFSGTGGEDLQNHALVTTACGTKYWYGGDIWSNPPGCTSTINRYNWVRSLHAGNQAGAFTTDGRWWACGSPCLSWNANTSLSSIDTGTCGRYVNRGGTDPC